MCCIVFFVFFCMRIIVLLLGYVWIVLCVFYLYVYVYACACMYVPPMRKSGSGADLGFIKGGGANSRS